MGERNGWVLTVREALPRVFRLWRHVRPTFHLPGIAAVDRSFLRSHGIEGIIWDVDGTLMRRHGACVAPELRAHFEAMLATPGTRHVILSNCGEDRFRELGGIFPSVPVLRAYHTSRGILFRRQLGGVDSWSDDEIRTWPPNGVRQVRKPNPDLIRYAIAELGGPRRESVLVVGDQYLTDIASANLAGVRSAKVPTLERRSFPLAVRGLQKIDDWAYKIASLRSRRGKEALPSRNYPNGPSV